MTAVDFVDFVDEVAAFTPEPFELHPAQRVLLGCGHDGWQPCDLEGEERELALQLFGGVETITDAQRAILVIVKGARIGGSLFGGLRSLHQALVAPVDSLALGELGFCVIVAPDIRLARQTMRYALGAAEAHPDIAPLIVAKDADSFTIQREHGRQVVIECLPAARGGSASRGRSYLCATLSEAAFFRDSNFVINDEEVYRSIAPRLLPGCQLTIESTPWAESGLLYSRYEKNFGNPQTALVALAPTLLMRPDKAAEVERERQNDPDNAAREFDAQFLAAGTGHFFEADTIDAAVSVEISGEQSRTYGAGADFAFTSDSSALAVVERIGDYFDAVHLSEQRPAKGAPLKPSEVVKTFAVELEPYHVRGVLADGHYIESVREHLSEHALYVDPAPGGQDGKASTYLRVRELLREGMLRLPDNARLKAQMKAILCQPTPGGGLKIYSPRKRYAGHGDLCSALVLAVWQADQMGTGEALTIEEYDALLAPNPWGEDDHGRGF